MSIKPLGHGSGLYRPSSEEVFSERGEIGDGTGVVGEGGEAEDAEVVVWWVLTLRIGFSDYHVVCKCELDIRDDTAIRESDGIVSELLTVDNFRVAAVSVAVDGTGEEGGSGVVVAVWHQF